MSSDLRARSSHRLGAHVFISYAREDAEIAARLQRELLAAGAMSVWLDRKNIEGGDDWRKEINEGLLKTQVLIALLTPHSVDSQRRWIRYEHAEARRLLRPVVPALFEECAVPSHLARFQYVDFRQDWNEGFVALLNAIGKIAPRFGESEQKFTDQCPPVARAFIGREQDLGEVFGLLEGDAHGVATGRRSLAIQGMGGSGKTMLAEELVRRLSVRYPGGVTVEQRGSRPESAQAVLQRWAKCILGDYPQPQWTVVDVRSELQKRYGELLVLIDDVSEKDAGDVDQLLKALPPDATRIVTTRWQDIESLGCLVYRLGNLDERDALLLLRDRLKSKGTDPGEDLLRKLADIVGGHALSMELVAGRCKNTVDLGEQVERLERRLGEGDVSRLALNVLGRNEKKDYSVALSLDESYQGLGEFDAESGTDWRRRFRALGVFPDGAMVDRGMVACAWGDADADADGVVDALDGLFSRAMLNRDATSGLYFNHPLIRAYACHLLKDVPGEFPVVWERYVRDITRRAEKGFQEPPQAWARLEPLRPHILHIGAELVEGVAAIVGDIEAASQPSPAPGPSTPGDTRGLERGLAFARAVEPYITRRPETGERGRRCLALGLASARALRDDPEALRFLRALGQWHDQRTPQLAERYYESGLALAEQRGDHAEWAALLTCQGELLRKTSRPQEALTTLARALEMHEASGHRDLQALTLRSMGETHWRMGRHAAALELHRRALDIYVSLGNRSGQGDLLNKIGSVRFNQGLHAEAIKLFEEALHVHREVGNRSMEAEDLNDMGIACKYLGDLESALPRLVDAFMIHRAIGSRRLQAISMCNIASVYLAKGFLRAAFEMASDAGVLAQETEDLVIEAWSLSYRGLALQEQHQREAALPLFREAVEKSRKVGDRRGEAGHLGHLARLCHDLGRPDEALALLEQAVQVMQASELPQAFGGRRLEDFRAMVAAIQAEREPTSGAPLAPGA